MRVHQNQVNPYAQLDAMHAAQKAAARREAERTRKKLFEAASESSSEAEACIVQLDPREQKDLTEQETRAHSPNSNSKQANSKQCSAEIDSTDEHKSVSDWV